MARGFKTGGRKKGSKNKKKGLADLKSEVVVQSAQSSEMPLAYMLRVMRDPMQPNQRRDEMARAAAPYVHAKLLAAKMEHKQEPEMTAAQARDELIAFLIEHGVRIAPPLGQTIEGEAIAAPDGQSEDTGGVAIANAQSGHRRRSCSRYPRRELPSKLRGTG